MTSIDDQIEALQAAVEGVRPRPQKPEDLESPDPPSHSPRVLIADDDSAFRSMLRGWLSDLGISDVIEAPDGAWAVELASKTRPDLILMDLRMPNMDGIEATRRVRAALPSVQVVMLSAYGDEGLQRAAESAGVYSYLTKGSSPELLLQTIRLAQTYRLHSEHGSGVQYHP